jgi:hypothetical protein
MVQLATINYDVAEQQFADLLATESLDHTVKNHPHLTSDFEPALRAALNIAYQSSPPAPAAHRFLQRILYHINRLKLFWYDDLEHYQNENSRYLNHIRDRIESAWQTWEQNQLPIPALPTVDVKQALRDRCARDVNPPVSATERYLQEEMTLAGYRRLLAIASLDGLVEASQLSRTLGGVGNDIQAVLTRLLVEEYGAGRLSRKHSTFFTTMLTSLDMNPDPEAYFDWVPWEVLAITNQSFLWSDRKRYFLRYIGGLLYGELTVPTTFRPYRAAGQRLGIPDAAMSYWNLHIKVDELHGQWMLDDVALPLVDRYPQQAWELLLGYDQQRHLGQRAGAAIAAAIKAADRTQNPFTPLERETP